MVVMAFVSATKNGSRRNTIVGRGAERANGTVLMELWGLLDRSSVGRIGCAETL